MNVSLRSAAQRLLGMGSPEESCKTIVSLGGELMVRQNLFTLEESIDGRMLDKKFSLAVLIAVRYSSVTVLYAFQRKSEVESLAAR